MSKKSVTRAEACELAAKLAKEKGGHPRDFMKEAWEILRKERGIERKPIKLQEPIKLQGNFTLEELQEIVRRIESEQEKN